MYKINDDNVFVGHIKQLLKNFNLPKCRVLRSDVDYSSILTENKIYIKNNKLYIYMNTGTTLEMVEKEAYVYNNPYRNITTNLRLDNMIYDNYTHRYLGRYLRFLRDWGDVDLMSMYNCFDGEINNKEISFNLSNYVLLLVEPFDWISTYSTYFYLSGSAFISVKGVAPKWEEGDIYYDVEGNEITSKPLDWETNFGNYSTTETPFTRVLPVAPTFTTNTYYKSPLKTFAGEDDGYIVYSIPVLAPFSYTLGLQVRGSVEMCIGFADPDLLGPSESESAPLLYADTYRKKNFSRHILLNDFFKSSNPNIKQFYNRSDLRLLLKVPKNIKSSIVVLEGDYLNSNIVVTGSSTQDNEVTFTYNPQLLSYVNNGNYLLADRLVEYLTGNVIGPLSESYDIIKLQQFLIKNEYIVSDNPGIWDKKDFDAIKKLIKEENIELNYFDSLGYCDKEVERFTQSANRKGGIV